MKKVLSYGGGLDSFAMLVKAIELGEIPDVCAFIDVGDGSQLTDGKDPVRERWVGRYFRGQEYVRCRDCGHAWWSSVTGAARRHHMGSFGKKYPRKKP